jgi:hypothetical protein
MCFCNFEGLQVPSNVQPGSRQVFHARLCTSFSWRDRSDSRAHVVEHPGDGHSNFSLSEEKLMLSLRSSEVETTLIKIKKMERENQEISKRAQ